MEKKLASFASLDSACSFGCRNCSLPCSHSRLRHALAISESDPNIQSHLKSFGCQRYLFENSAPWAYKALHYPGVQLQVSFETARTLRIFYFFHEPHGNLKKFGDKSRLQFAQGHRFSGGFIEPVLEPIAQMQAQVR